MMGDPIPFARGNKARLLLLGFFVFAYFSDPAHSQTIYWSNQSNSTIKVGNLDGSGSPTVLYDTSDGLLFPLGITVDAYAGRVYWADYNDRTVNVAQLDGSGAPYKLFEGIAEAGAPSCVAIDTSSGKVYWGDGNGNRIMAGAINGTGTSTELFGPSDVLFSVDDIAIDALGGKIYWAGAIFDGSPNQRRIFVGNIDGSGTVSSLYIFPDGSGQINGIALDLAGGKIYFSRPFEILVANIDGSGVPVELFNASDGLQGPVGIALDFSGGKIFWIDPLAVKIQCGNIDGSGAPTDLFDASDGLQFPTNLAIVPYPIVTLTIPPGVSVSSPFSLLFGTLLLALCGWVAVRRHVANRLRGWDSYS